MESELCTISVLTSFIVKITVANKEYYEMNTRSH